MAKLPKPTKRHALPPLNSKGEEIDELDDLLGEPNVATEPYAGSPVVKPVGRFAKTHPDAPPTPPVLALATYIPMIGDSVWYLLDPREPWAAYVTRTYADNVEKVDLAIMRPDGTSLTCMRGVLRRTYAKLFEVWDLRGTMAPEAPKKEDGK